MSSAYYIAKNSLSDRTFKPTFMEPESVINLFDSWWFYPNVNSSLSNPITHYQNHTQNEETFLLPYVSSPLTINAASGNDHSLNSINNVHGDAFSPNSVLFSSHIEANLSQNQETEKSPPQQKKIHGPRKKVKKTKSKSLSELECEEVRGFMDLGFVFSEEDRASNLVEIIPGLQRLGEEKFDEKNDISDNKSSVTRPYLSEAWSVLEKENIDISLQKWRISEMRTEKDIKTSLKLWAHTVASVIV